MDQQQTIFDESFQQQVSIRRRDLLHIGLRLYVLLMLVVGLFFTAIGVYVLISTPRDPIADPVMQVMIAISYFIGTVMPGVTIFLMGLSVGLEWKWAIRLNWGCALFWVAIFVLLEVITSPTGMVIYMMVAIAALLIPYVLMLALIQRKWERAVSSRHRLT